MSEVTHLDVPTLGDCQAAFTRLLGDRGKRMCGALADALIVRDWISHTRLCMQCCLRAQTTGCPHVDCDRLLLRLLDDRPTTGRPGTPQ